MKQMKNCDLKIWWRAAVVRAIRSVAQSAIAVLGVSTMITEVDWKVVAATAAMTGILSILNSIATGLPEVQEDPVEKGEE